MRISRVIVGTAVTGAAMAAVLGAFQLTSGGSHPAGNRPAHVGSQVDFNTNGRSPDDIKRELADLDNQLATVKEQCADQFNQAQDDAARSQVSAACNDKLDHLQQLIQQDEQLLADPPAQQPQAQPSTSPSAG